MFKRLKACFKSKGSWVSSAYQIKNKEKHFLIKFYFRVSTVHLNQQKNLNLEITQSEERKNTEGKLTASEMWIALTAPTYIEVQKESKGMIYMNSK